MSSRSCRAARRCRRTRACSVRRSARQVPAGEDARRRVDVGLGVVADAHGEELHDLAAEVLLRHRPGVGAPVEPDEHRRCPWRFPRADVWKLPSALSRSISIWPRTLAGSSLAFAAMYRVASGWPRMPASFVYAVAKWLCQKSVIFSWSGRLVCSIRNSHRCRASAMTVFGEKPRARVGHDDLHVSGLHRSCVSTSSGIRS